jgi:hypothetical protein
VIILVLFVFIYEIRKIEHLFILGKNEKIKKKEDREWILFLFLFGAFLFLIFAFFAPFIFTSKSEFLDFNFNHTGQIGDTIGGLMNPFVATAGVFVTGLAFYVQYKANKQQRELFEREQLDNKDGLQTQIDNQNSQFQRQQFVNKFYELLKLHKENLAEIELEDESGRKVFVLLIREYREILKIVRTELGLTNVKNGNLKIIELAYMILFYGTGPNSTRVLKKSMPEYDDDFMDRLARVLHSKKRIIKERRKLSFVPFEGHQHRLGHYFRHLYQVVTYVHNNSNLTSEEKKAYVKIVRAQLSNHEQALLFFNSLSKLGRPWFSEGLISDYALVKNLPNGFIDEMSEVDVKSIYPKVKFEYEDSYPIIQN